MPWSWQRFKTRGNTYWGATLLQYLSMPFLKYSTASHLTFTSSMWLLKILCGGKTEKNNNRYTLSWCLTQLIAGKLKPHSTCPVCCINTYPTSSLPLALNYDTIIISLILAFTCCTNSCSKDKNNLIKSLDVSRGKSHSIFSAPYALIQVWRERVLLKTSWNTHWVYNTDVRRVRLSKVILYSVQTQEASGGRTDALTVLFWRRRNTGDFTKFCSLYRIYFYPRMNLASM